jgi:hypothetical protein
VFHAAASADGHQTAPLAPEALWSTVGRSLQADALLVSEAGSNDAYEAITTDEVAELLNAGIADLGRPTLINVGTTPVGAQTP